MSLLQRFWPRLQIVRRGYQYAIVKRFGRTVCHALGPHGIALAWHEIQSGKPIPFPAPKAEPEPEWKQKIRLMNERCEEVGKRYA